MLREVKLVAIIIWIIIFLIASFVLGQYLASSGKFNIIDKLQEIKKNSDKEEVIEEAITKVPTFEINKEFAQKYFNDYCNNFVEYLDTIEVPNEKTEITSNIATKYLMYILKNTIYNDIKVESIDESKIALSEEEANRVVNTMFDLYISKEYKEDEKYGYDDDKNTYIIEVEKESKQKVYKLSEINSNDNEIVLTYLPKEENSKKSQIKIYLECTSNRYIISAISK